MTQEEKKTGMPFDESQAYVDDLVARTTATAIMRHGLRRRLALRRAAGIAAAVLIMCGATVAWHEKACSDARATADAEQQNPLASFLNSISDEQAQAIEYYDIEEIAE